MLAWSKKSKVNWWNSPSYKYVLIEFRPGFFYTERLGRLIASLGRAPLLVRMSGGHGIFHRTISSVGFSRVGEESCAVGSREVVFRGSRRLLAGGLWLGSGRALGGLWAGSAGATCLEHSIAVCSASTAGSVGACSGFYLFWDPGQGDGRLLRLMKAGLSGFNRVCLFVFLSEWVFLDMLFRDGFAQSVTECGLCWCFEFWWVELWGGGGFLLAFGVDDSYPDAVFNVHL